VAVKQVSPIYMAKPVIGEEEIAEVQAVLRSGLISDGEEVRIFEKEFSGFIGTKHAVAVSSGTAAIYVALISHGIGPGDEVITTPFSFIATANAVLLTGARPVFADIRSDTFNIDPDEVIKKITPETKALLPVHLYGLPCDMEALTQIAEEHNLALIEDACQAHGAEYRNRKAGSYGTGCFSFYPTKNMTTGEGGMITTNDPEIAVKARLIVNHGQNRRYHHETIGYNYRMTNIAAAIGLCQLKRLPFLNGMRTRNAMILNAGLQGIKGIELPRAGDDLKHAYHQYTIRLTEQFALSREDFRGNLRGRGTYTEVYYPLPIHRQPLYQKLGYHDHLPVAEKCAEEVVSLPVHPSLNGEDLEHIIECVRGCLS